MKDCSGFNDEDQQTIKDILTGDDQGELDMADDAMARDICIMLSIAVVARLWAFYCADTMNKVVR